MNIQFVNLQKNVSNIRHKLEKKITDFLFDDCYYVNGPQVKEFEHKFADYIGTEYCLGVNSGTDALKLSIKILANEYTLKSFNMFASLIFDI